MTNDGIVTPMVAIAISSISCQRLFFNAARMPIGMAVISTNTSVTRPSLAETGAPVAMKSLTVLPVYLYDGPKSPCSRLPR